VERVCCQGKAQFGVYSEQLVEDVEQLRNRQPGRHELVLGSDVVQGRSLYPLHPVLLDAAVRAIGVAPLSIGQVEMRAAVPAQAWAVVHRAAELFEIRICNQEGAVCVRLRDMQVIPYSAQQPHDKALLWGREWKLEQAPACQNGTDLRQHWIVFAEMVKVEQYRLEIERQLEATCIELPTCGDSIEERFTGYVEQLTATLQRILQESPSKPTVVQLLIGGSVETQELLWGLSGLMRTASEENPNIVTQVIGVEEQVAADTLLGQLIENKPLGVLEARYRESRRWRPEFQVLQQWAAVTGAPWKPTGVYLITGGAGGLGLLVAREIVSEAPDAAVVLVGRAELSEARQQQVRRLQGGSRRVEYRRVDVCDGGQVQAVVQEIQHRYGQLNGVVHAAGLTRDGFLLKKKVEDVRAVLGPKVQGTRNLDRATREQALDFFMLFSSAAAVWGNVGQGDYAAANGYMDGYAVHRQRLVERGDRRPRDSRRCMQRSTAGTVVCSCLRANETCWTA
jgi:polyketide synthase PksN